MIDRLKIRQATEDDIDFVCEAIFESEKSNSQVISSCNIFGITEVRFKEILQDVLLEDIGFYDYYLSGFLIAELNGEYIGALGSWLEGGDNNPSGIIKATILFQYLDKSKMDVINRNANIVRGLTLPREAGALQLEHGYTREKFRRKGVFLRLTKEIIKINFAKYSFNKVQGILFKDNYKSLNANLKFGFEIVDEKRVDDPQIFQYFPYNSKILVEFSGNKILNL